MINAVFDTNVFLQAAVSDAGPAFACWRLVEQGAVTVYLTESILLEVEDVLSGPKIKRRFPILTNVACRGLVIGRGGSIESMRWYPVVLSIFIACMSSQLPLAQGRQSNLGGPRPDLTGKWKINVAESRFSAQKGSIGKDIIWTMDIRQKLPLVSVAMHSQVDGGIAEDWKYEFYTDGRPRRSADNANDRMIAKWENDKLIVRTYESPNALVGEQQYELLAGGNRLRVTFRLAKGRWGYDPNPTANVLDEQYTEYIVFERVKS